MFYSKNNFSISENFDSSLQCIASKMFYKDKGSTSKLKIIVSENFQQNNTRYIHSSVLNVSTSGHKSCFSIF